MQKIDIRKTSALKTRMRMQIRMSKKTRMGWRSDPSLILTCWFYFFAFYICFNIRICLFNVFTSIPVTKLYAYQNFFTIVFNILDYYLIFTPYIGILHEIDPFGFSLCSLSRIFFMACLIIKGLAY